MPRDAQRWAPQGPGWLCHPRHPGRPVEVLWPSRCWGHRDGQHPRVLGPRHPALPCAPQACGGPTWSTPTTSTSLTWPPSTRWWTGPCPSSATCGRWTAATPCTAGRRRASGSRVSAATGVPARPRSPREAHGPALPSSRHPPALHPRRLQVPHLPHALLQAGAEVGGAAAAQRFPGCPQPRHVRRSLQGAAAFSVGAGGPSVSPIPPGAVGTPQIAPGAACMGFKPGSLRAAA